MHFDKNHDIALIANDSSTMTYSELLDVSAVFSRYLIPRSLVLSLCENSIASVAGYCSFLNNQVVPILYSNKADLELIADALGTYTPRYLYIPSYRCEEFPSYDVIYRFRNYALLENRAVSLVHIHQDLGLLLSTSGSTGSRKLVRLSYNNIESNAKAIASYLGIDKYQRAITSLPMNYVYGLFVINSHLVSGATVLLTDDSVIMKSFWDFFKREHATSLAGVPWTFEQLKRIRFSRMELPTLQYITQSGGKFSYELQKEFADLLQAQGKKLFVMYGQTEGTGRMFYLPSELSGIKIGSIGKPLEIGRAELVDEEGHLLEEAESEGELVYYGTNVSMGYAETLYDLGKADENCGRLLTGDIAKRDEDGYYYIVGRKKRFLKIYGNRISLDEVDRLVKQKFCDVDCASTGQDDYLKVYIDQADVVSDVRQYISSVLNISEKNTTVDYISCIPKNESGKVIFAKLV